MFLFYRASAINMCRVYTGFPAFLPPWHIHMCDVTYPCVWRDSFICVTWLIHTCDTTHSYIWRPDSFICVVCTLVFRHSCPHDTSEISSHMIQMILYSSTLVQTNVSLLQSFLWKPCLVCRHSCTYDTFICVTSPVHVNESCHTYECVMSHIWMTHSKHMNGSCHTHEHLSMCVAWLIHTCGMTHSYVWHDSFMYMETRLSHMCRECTGSSVFLHTRRIHMRDMTHSCVWSESFIYVP